MFFRYRGSLFHTIDPEKAKLVLKQSLKEQGGIRFLELYLGVAFLINCDR